MQLTVLSNLETLSSHLINEKMAPSDRLNKLKDAAVIQLQSLSKINFNYQTESPHVIIKGIKKIE